MPHKLAKNSKLIREQTLNKAHELATKTKAEANRFMEDVKGGARILLNPNGNYAFSSNVPSIPVNVMDTSLVKKELEGGVSKFSVSVVGKGTDNSLNKTIVPTVKSGEFNKWFNSLTSEQLDLLWEDKRIRKAIERQLRAPGGMHEWHLVSRAPTFKRWGVTSEQIRDLRTAINEVEFVNPPGKHGGLGSTKAHNELLEIIDSAKDYETFVRRLNNWANYRLEGGVESLPEGLWIKQ